MPTTKQIDSNRTTSIFNQVLGGYYGVGVLNANTTRGLWWGNEAANAATRRSLRYTGSDLETGSYRRSHGIYIRCVSEEKTVSDLTYMRDRGLWDFLSITHE